MSHPKTRQKCHAPLLKISGVVKPKDQAKAMPSTIAKRLNYVTGVINGNVTPKDKTKMPSPLLKITGVLSGVVTPKDKMKAMLPCWKKSNKNDKQPYWSGVLGGVVTPKDKDTEAKPKI